MKIIRYFSEISDQYDGYIIDVWGVLHNGERPFKGAIETVRNLNNQDKKCVLLSNSPMRSSHVSHQLESHYDLSPNDYDGVVTSGEATHEYLKSQKPGLKIFYIGRDYFFQAIQDLAESGHVEIVEDVTDADVMLAAGTGSLNVDVEEDIEILKTGVDKGIKLICSNPDLVVQVGDNLYPCPGQWAAKYQELGGDVLYFGKPHALVYKECHQVLGGMDKSRILAIGDSLHTDITGAHNFDIESMFNIVGIHSHELACEVSGNLDNEKLSALMKDQDVKPTWVMEGIKW